jgi:hypothetical protein
MLTNRHQRSIASISSESRMDIWQRHPGSDRRNPQDIVLGATPPNRRAAPKPCGVHYQSSIQSTVQLADYNRSGDPTFPPAFNCASELTLTHTQLYDAAATRPLHDARPIWRVESSSSTSGAAMVALRLCKHLHQPQHCMQSKGRRQKSEQREL